jgi:hypothetical protein
MLYRIKNAILNGEKIMICSDTKRECRYIDIFLKENSKLFPNMKNVALFVGDGDEKKFNEFCSDPD